MTEQTALDKMVNYIEHIFERPRMYAFDAREYEMVLLTAFRCYTFMAEIDDKVDLWQIWRDEVKLAFPGRSTVGISLGSDGIDQVSANESRKLRFDRVITHMKRIWKILLYGPF